MVRSHPGNREFFAVNASEEDADWIIR